MTGGHGDAVFGAIGRCADGAVDRLRAAHGSTGSWSVREGQVALEVHGSVARWGHGSVRGWSWGPAVSPPSPPRRWQDAARHGTAGVAVEDDGAVVLHADAAAVVPVFVARSGDGLLFSSALDGLARSLPGPLHVDRGAWWEILAAGMVLSSRTPFEEIERLSPGTAHRVDAAGRLGPASMEPWRGVELTTSSEGTADALIERVRAVTSRVQGRQLIVPLSGGWDSRFLAAVAAADGRPTTTVTAADERGRLEEEVLWAREVATRLGLEHHTLSPVDDWWSAVEAAALDTHHLTSMHHWFQPLKAYLAGTSGTMLDGLAAGVLLNNGLLSPAALGTTGTAVADEVRARLAAPLAPLELLAPAVATEVDEHVGRRVAGAWERVADHPAAHSLLVLDLRTVRAISLPPMSMFAAVTPVATPFTDPEVMGVALSVPLQEKADGRFYRRVLARLGSGLETIPSTNDTPVERWHDPRPDLSPAVAARTRRALGHETVRHAIGPRLRSRMSAGRVQHPADRRHRDVVRGLVLYTLWVERYGHLLADPVLVGPPAGAATSGPPAVTPTEPVVADPSELPDGRWLPMQAGVRTAWVRPADDRDGDLVVREVRPPASPPRPPASPSRPPASTSHPADAYDRVLVGGPWRSMDELDRSLTLAERLLATDGRIAVTVSLVSGATSAKRPSIAELCELLATRLDLVHAEVRQGQVRVLGRPAALGEGTVGRRVPSTMQSAIVAAFEKRERERRGHTADLERDLEAARDATIQERSRRERAERDLALEREQHARARARIEELVADVAASVAERDALVADRERPTAPTGPDGPAPFARTDDPGPAGRRHEQDRRDDGRDRPVSRPAGPRERVRAWWSRGAR